MGTDFLLKIYFQATERKPGLCWSPGPQADCFEAASPTGWKSRSERVRHRKRQRRGSKHDVNHFRKPQTNDDTL